MEGKNSLVHIVVGLAVVGVVTAGIIGYNTGKQDGMQAMHMDMMSMEGKKETSNSKALMDHSQMTMDEMTEGLDGLKGDAFDKAFIEMMIVHHQGAVDMAELIPANAKHEELKKLGRDIITAQTQEITMMKQWLKDWGYENTTSQKMDMDMQMMDHSMMGH
jgi:uncharacterized protein (DUF305 family)